jgi:hypothetical protein
MWLGVKFGKKKWRTREEVIENSVTKGFVFCISQHVVLGSGDKYHMMGQPCGTYGRVEEFRQRCCRLILNERDHLKNLRADGG